MARRDTNFYYSFLVLPAAKREAILAVWDFFRAVDDAVDEAGITPGVVAAKPRNNSRSDSPSDSLLAASDEIARWRSELADCFEGRTPATPQARALVPHVRTFNLPRQRFEDVIDGVEMDVGHRNWETFDDLHRYCLRVASAVGLVCIEIFGYRNPACRQYAVDLGVALQLTNILRDLGQDLRAGRLYLPQEDLRRFGASESALRAGVVTEGVRQLLEHQARRAHDYFDRAVRGLPAEDARSLVAARIMCNIYRALLRRIERRGFGVFHATVRLSRPHKALIALWTWAGTRLGIA